MRPRREERKKKKGKAVMIERARVLASERD